MNMDTASFQFVLYGLAAALLSNVNRSRVWRSIVLSAASVAFLALLDRNPIHFIPLAGFLLLGYAGLFLIQRGMSKAMVVSILAVILAYIWLKKYTLLPDASFIHSFYFTVGLSYIFFRVLHLLIEAGDSRDKTRIGLGAYLLYTLNFTTLVSGPIQRYDEFARDQFALQPIPLGIRVVGLQLERIVRGFFKVNVLAMLLNYAREDAFIQLTHPMPLSLKLYAAFRLIIIYPIFLYANFSGYIDIVIAIARLMRVRLPENFDRPFSAASFIDFWSRWHITLSTWLKTYVYNPLLVALMRRFTSPSIEPALGVFSFFVTFFLVGLWHGRTSEFITFGVLQGGGVAINKIWQLTLTRALGRKGYKALAANPFYIAAGRGLTFSWFAFTLFWFWAGWTQIKTAADSLSPIQWLGVWAAVFVSAMVVLAIWENVRAMLLAIRTSEGPVLTSRYARVVYASALGFTAFVITILLNQPAPGLVYKAF
jgi:D-alanyl-lipoteichoic acid acyltransferase DltB (MBOAT superfamily)